MYYVLKLPSAFLQLLERHANIENTKIYCGICFMRGVFM